MFGALCILAIFFADLIKPPSIVPSDSGGVVVSTKGEERRWTARWTMEPIERDRKKAIRFTERGQGHVSPYSGEVRWTLEAVSSGVGAYGQRPRAAGRRSSIDVTERDVAAQSSYGPTRAGP